MNDFHYLRPLWLLAYLPLGFLVFWLWRVNHSHQEGGWAKICDKALLPFVVVSRGTRNRLVPISLFTITAALLIQALAGPAWQKFPIPIYSKQAPLVVVLDLSNSMLATDVQPNRITRARLKLHDLLDERREGQTGLVVYSSHPFVVTPLTLDTETLRLHLNELHPELLPVQGSRPSVALKRAAELLSSAGITKGDILLVADGIEDVDSLVTARELNARGIRVSMLVVGTESGGPIPLKDGGFLLNQGQPVLAKVDFERIAQFVQLGGGRMHRISPDDTDIRYLLAMDSVDITAAPQAVDVSSTRWRDEGPWLLLAALPLAALAFRRGWYGVIVILILPWPNLSSAATTRVTISPEIKADAKETAKTPATPKPNLWEKLWLNKEQQALKAFENKQHGPAAEQFESPQWRGAAHYRAGDYARAVDEFGKIDSPEADYNRGNALAKLGKYDEAVKAYDDVLKKQAQHADAAHNKKILEEHLKQQQQQKNPQQNGQQQSDNSGQGSPSNNSNNHGSPQGAQPPSAKDSDRDGNGSGSTQVLKNTPSTSQNAGNNLGIGNITPEKDDLEKRKLLQELQARSQLPPPSNQQEDRNTGEQNKQNQNEQNRTTPNNLSAADQFLLRRIPDDPGGLLRRKFRQQYETDQATHKYPTTVVEPW